MEQLDFVVDGIDLIDARDEDGLIGLDAEVGNEHPAGYQEKQADAHQRGGDNIVTDAGTQITILYHACGGM